MSIPIVIINRDRLQYTEKLCDQLLVLGYDNITILDMGSTYKPLISWYKEQKFAEVILEKNLGHRELWNSGIIDSFRSSWIAVSDSDIELNTHTPKGFIEHMIVTAKDFYVDKCGLAIEYQNIPNQFLRNVIVPIESRYWDNKLPHVTDMVYMAPVDTSFCVVRTESPFTYRAVRLGGEYTCKHLPWYEDWSNLTEEEQYYMDNCDESIGTIKKHYLLWKQQNP